MNLNNNDGRLKHDFCTVNVFKFFGVNLKKNQKGFYGVFWVLMANISETICPEMLIFAK